MNKPVISRAEQIFYPGWLMVSQLRSGQPVEDGKALYRRACQLVKQAREELAEAGFCQKSSDIMLYAFCALLDESVLNREKTDDGWRTWQQDPLQAHFFGTLNAGEELWERIREQLKLPAPDVAVLTCLCRTLQLGFTGQYRSQDDERREDVIRALTARVPAFTFAQDAPVVVRAPGYRAGRTMYWLSWGGGYCDAGWSLVCAFFCACRPGGTAYRAGITMHVRSRLWLTILSLFLTLWLISGFLPLSAVNQIILTLVSVVAAGLVLWYQWRCLSSRRDIPEKAGDDGLPPEYFQGHVLLVAGNSDAWFEPGQAYRETASGWYLRVDTPEQMRILAERLSYSRPALCGQVVVMLGLLPERHTSDEAFLSWLRNWQRAVMQCRQWLNTTPPVLVTLMVSEPSPQNTSLNKHSTHWFTLTPDLPGMHIRLTEAGAIPAEEWLQACDAASRLRCVSELLWLNAMLSWYNRVTDALTAICRQEHFYFRPVAVGFCLTSVAARPGNLWQQQLTSLTALPPPAGVSSQVLPLPDILLSGIPRHRGLSH